MKQYINRIMSGLAILVGLFVLGLVATYEKSPPPAVILPAIASATAHYADTPPAVLDTSVLNNQITSPEVGHLRSPQVVIGEFVVHLDIQQPLDGRGYAPPVYQLLANHYSQTGESEVPPLPRAHHSPLI